MWWFRTAGSKWNISLDVTPFKTFIWSHVLCCSLDQNICNNWGAEMQKPLDQWFSTSFLETRCSAHFVCLPPLFNTPDLNHQLIRRDLHELNWVCPIRETYKMCRAENHWSRRHLHQKWGTGRVTGFLYLFLRLLKYFPNYSVLVFKLLSFFFNPLFRQIRIGSEFLMVSTATCAIATSINVNLNNLLLILKCIFAKHWII